MEKLSQPEAGSSPLAFATEYAQPLWRQYLIILAKNLVSYWRRVSLASQAQLRAAHLASGLPIFSRRGDAGRQLPVLRAVSGSVSAKRHHNA